MADNEKICFGLSWDAHDATCTGCPVFGQCRTEKYKKFTASAASTSPPVLRAPVIPSVNLTRTDASPSAPATRPPQFYPTQQYAVPTHARYTPQTAPPPQRPPEQQARYLQPQPQTPQQPQYFPAIFHPVQHLMPNEQAPFLTVLEPVLDDLPIWKRIMAESARAALKGVLGHGTYLADHLTVFKPPR